MFKSSETGFQHMCESVFVRLCQIVGTSVQVAIKRETRDIMERLDKSVQGNDDTIIMQSGSVQEGFRLRGKDLNYMGWPDDHRVILDMCQSEYYSTENKILILSDSSESPPGFTLLVLLMPTTDIEVQSACAPINDRLCICSSQLRQQTQLHSIPGSRVH